MALVVKDRVKETTTTTGTGTITLAGASQGFQSFSVIGNGNTTYYTIVDPATGDWEVGVGTYTSSGTTLSRTTVLESSNAGSLVPFGSGTKDVFVTYPAERAVYLDTAGSAVTVLDVGTLGTSTANITTANITSGTVSTTPTSSTDIANKTYVDNLVASGTSYHTPVKYEVPNTTGNLNALYNNGTGGVGATLTNNGTLAAFAPDGPTASVNDRILIYNQTNAYENGVYEVTTVGSGSVAWVLTRTADADSYGLKDPNALGNGDAFFVTSGNTGAGETYICNTTGVITFGTTAITFAQISSAQVYSAGTGISLSPATTINIANTGVSASTYGSASAVPVFAVNAQGQITSVTNTNIAISGSAVSGNISGSAGSVANALTAGTYLTSGGTFDGSAARTFAVDATDANTASKVVARDASGNFSAGTITATLSGAATSATTATNLAGGTLGDIPYQSAAGTTAFLTGGTNGYVLKSNGAAAPTWTAATISGVQLGNNLNTLTLGTYLTGTSYNGSAAITAAVDATSANTASKVVARDASGNFSAGTITASLSGNATSATTATTATTATQVSNSLTLATSGTGLTGSATFNGATAQTFTVTSNATNANTASTIVARDASGNFSAGTITATLSGNASTATSAGYSTYLITQDIRTLSPSSTAAYRLGFGFTSWANNNTSPYADYLALRSYSDASGGNDNLLMFNKSTIGMRLWQQSFGSATAYSSYADVLMTNNYNSYSPTLTGTGASGTWGISITGNAANITAYTINQSVGTGNSPTFADLYVSNWFRNNTSNTGLYNQSTTQHLSSNTNGYWDMSSTTTVSGIRLYTGGHVTSLRGYVYANNSNEIGFLNSTGGWSWKMDNSGNGTATGSVTAYSDERLKKDWEPVAENFVEKLAAVKTGTYTRTDIGERQAGSSAQDWQKLLPEVVRANNEGILSLAYGNAAVVACVELAKEVMKLRAEVQDLKGKINVQ
jgi:hypothetical protein